MSDNINVEVKRKNPSIPPKNLRQLTKQVAEIEGTIDDINESVEEAEQDVHEIKNAIDNSNDFTIRNGKMVRKNKRYAPAQYSGLGEIYLEKNETFLGREFNEFVTNVTVPDPSIIADAIDGIVYDRGRKEFLAYELVEGERVYYAEWNKFDKWESVEDYTPDAGYDFICETDNKAYRWTEETTPDLIETVAHYGNVLKQEMVNFSNTIYHIQYDYDLIGKTIEIPDGCILKYEGGNCVNGIIIGNVRVRNFSPINNSVFQNGYNFADGNTLFASDIGMIPNSQESKGINNSILKRAIENGNHLIIDDSYFISNESIYTNKDIYLEGKDINCTLYIECNSNTNSTKLFRVTEGCKNIIINNLCFKRFGTPYFTHLLYNLTDFVIDNIRISNCVFDNISIVYLTGADQDFSVHPYGIKNFEFLYNTINGDSKHSSTITLQSQVISDTCVISHNIFNKTTPLCIWGGVDTNYTYRNTDYSCPFYIEDNIVNGCVDDTFEAYNTFVLLRITNTVYYRRNKISNIISIAEATNNDNVVSYDAYMNVLNYYCEDNQFINIATIPKNGVAKTYQDEFGKSKARGHIRSYKNNLWYNNYDEIKSLILKDYPDFSITDEQYREASKVALFWYQEEQDIVIFENNTIKIVNGMLEGCPQNVSYYPYNYVKKMYFRNNIIDTDVYLPSRGYYLFASINNSITYIEGNMFINPYSSTKELHIFNVGKEQDYLTMRSYVINNTFVGYVPVNSDITILGELKNNNYVINNTDRYFTHRTAYPIFDIDTCNNDTIAIFYAPPKITDGKINIGIRQVKQSHDNYYCVSFGNISSYIELVISNPLSNIQKTIVLKLDNTNSTVTAYEANGDTIIEVSGNNSSTVFQDDYFIYKAFGMSKGYQFAIAPLTNDCINNNVSIKMKSYSTYTFNE